MYMSSTFLPRLVKEINANYRHTNLTYLKNILNSFPETNYRELLDAFRTKSSHSIYNNHYYKFRIYSNNNYEINIINWNNHSRSKIHNHAENGCILKVLEGSLLEKKYNTDLLLIDTNTLEPGKTHYINNTELHSIENTNNGISYSLHIYSPPNFSAKTFN